MRVKSTPQTVTIHTKNVAVQRTNPEPDCSRVQKPLPEHHPRLLLVAAKPPAPLHGPLVRLQELIPPGGELRRQPPGGHNGVALLRHRHLIRPGGGGGQAQPGDQGLYPAADTGAEQCTGKPHQLPPGVPRPPAHPLRPAQVPSHHRATLSPGAYRLPTVHLRHRSVPLRTVRLLPRPQPDMGGADKHPVLLFPHHLPPVHSPGIPHALLCP